MSKRRPSRITAVVSWLAALCCLPGGALWALTPLGIMIAKGYLAEGPAGFWALFFPAPLLMFAGFAGLWLLGCVGSGWLARAGFAVTLIGLVLVISGNAGQFLLGLDDAFMVTAPAYRAFRIGLVVLGVGALLFGVAAARDRSVPVWGALPFAVGAICGLAAFTVTLGSLGSGLWTVFGAAWIWLGLSVLFSRFAAYLRERKTRKLKPEA